MKKLLVVFTWVTLLFMTGCYDDTLLTGRVDNLENRVTKLEELCEQMNTNISSLHTIVNALQNNDYVKSVTPVMQDGKEIGYTITFTKSNPITIYHGKDGKDGINGKDGVDGTNGQDGIDGTDGKDGHTPVIGVRQDVDGIYYWTLDGEWLTDNAGKKIKAQGTDGRDGIDGEDGKDGVDGNTGENGADGRPGQDGQDGVDGQDGITPQLKIENDYWYISYDNGSSWIQLGKATGEDGKDGINGANGLDGRPGQDGEDGRDGVDGQDGDSMFSGVDYTTSADYVIFTLADGTQIKLPTWAAFEALQTLCNQMNTNISSLQALVNALQNNDYITRVTPLMQDGKEVGYTLTFAKSNPITIYHGKDGQNGTNGADGKDGVDGQDGATPIIGVRLHTDGIYYWTLNGEWLTDESGNKIRAQGTDGRDGIDGEDGKDGVDGEDGTNGADGHPGADGTDGQDAITPQLKIENNYWYVSYDNGNLWTQLGKATGEDGKDGVVDISSIFESLTQDEDFVYLTLAGTGEVIAVPKHHPLSITFVETEDIRVLVNQTYSIPYAITGADENTVIKALAQDGFRAVVKKTDYATGTLEITTPATILPSEVLVFVTDGKERTIMRSINFVEGVIIITDKSYTVDNNGGTIEVELSTNIDYTVDIPDTDQSWISVVDIQTRVVMRDETLILKIEPNSDLLARFSTVRLVDNLGVTSETILITQKSGTAKSVHVATAGTLDQLISADDKAIIEELTVTGKLNTFDFDFIRGMSNLKMLDLSATDNTTIPSSCLANSNIPIVLLPLQLTAIPNRAFYQAKITSLYIPEHVATIGDDAFYQCTSLTGNLIIPNATTSIGANCFKEATFNGTLTLGKGLQTIGANAFEGCAQFTGALTIPNSVTSLGEKTFYNCSGFNGKLSIGTGITEIPASTFCYCSSLTGSPVIGENVITIGYSAFACCVSLTGNLIIPNKVKTIGGGAFYHCIGFTGRLEIGESVTSIGSGAFICTVGAIISHKESSATVYYNTYYAYKKLNFSKIYCKSNVLPVINNGNGNTSSAYSYKDYFYESMVYGPSCYKTTDKVTGSGIAIVTDYTNTTYYPIPSYKSGSFYQTAGDSKPPYLGVPVGCKDSYATADGWKEFQLIEEIEF